MPIAPTSVNTPPTTSSVAAAQVACQRHRRGEAQHRDDQRRLEQQRAVPAQAEQDHERHGVDVERVQREHAVDRLRAAQQPPGAGQDRQRHRGEREVQGRIDQVHSKISRSGAS
jgi:hypothetical protein